MTITQLEYLIAVVNYGSFSAAAERCFVTQPSLSTQIKNLEDELGVIILDRSKKPITPTQAGFIIIPQIKETISSFYGIRERVEIMSGEIKGTLTLGVIPTISPYILHKFIPPFLRKFPDVELEIREMYTFQIENELKKGTIDVGLLAGGFTKSAEIIEENLYHDKLYLYVSKKHKLYGKTELDVSSIDTDDLLLLPDGHCLRAQTLNICGNISKGLKQVKFESGSLETIIRMVDSTGRLTVIPQMMIPFINESTKSQLVSFKSEAKAQREITLAVSSNFYKKSIYKALKEEILKATQFDCLL